MMSDRCTVNVYVSLADWRKHGKLFDEAGALSESEGWRGVDSAAGIEPLVTCGVVSLAAREREAREREAGVV